MGGGEALARATPESWCLFSLSQTLALVSDVCLAFRGAPTRGGPSGPSLEHTDTFPFCFWEVGSLYLSEIVFTSFCPVSSRVAWLAAQEGVPGLVPLCQEVGLLPGASSVHGGDGR